MALKPNDYQHAMQIQAGTIGRNSGHKFEIDLTKKINDLNQKVDSTDEVTGVFYGNPEISLIKKCLKICDWHTYDSLEAIALGGLATSEHGKEWRKVTA